MNITKKKQIQRFREENYWLPMGRGKGEGQYSSRELRGTNYYV